MDQVAELRNKARQSLDKTDYLLSKLYPSVDDPKILVAAVENIFLSLSYSLSALLYYELRFHRVPLFKEDFESKYDMFSNKIALRYGFDRSYNNLIVRIKDLVEKHKQSPVEFSRKHGFVICDDGYHSEVLTQAKCLMYFDKAKDFFKKMHEITEQDEHIFGFRSKFRKEEQKKRGTFCQNGGRISHQ